MKLKTEKMESCETTASEENVCTICGQTSRDKAAFNAHIKAHLKEKLNSKMKRNKEGLNIKAEPGLTERKELTKSLPVKRKMESLSSPEQQPARLKIKMESVDLPELDGPDTPSPEIPSLDDSFLSLASRSDLNNDLSLILDQIERDFERLNEIERVMANETDNKRWTEMACLPCWLKSCVQVMCSACV